MKILGALPAAARPSEQQTMINIDGIYWDGRFSNPQSARELVYRSLEAADQADVRRQALMTCQE
jgi:hypothetical protein